MRPTRGPPLTNGEDRAPGRVSRSSELQLPNLSGIVNSTDRHSSESLFATIALDLLADARRDRRAAGCRHG